VLNDFPDLRISTRENEGHFYRLFYDSRLVIATTNYTAFLQSFFVNKPTLLLWDPEYFTVRDSAKEYYNLLHDAGILYYSPELCAKKVNEIHQNPMEWWMTAEVQAAKNEYCEHFCRITGNMEGELAEVINEMRK
jgi:putative transferase (TIGR04331 family)